MIEIAKELLSEVLNINYSFKLEEPIKDYNLNTLEWWQDEVYKEQLHSINIYELTAHKCKEWAISKGYILQSGYQNCICINFTDNLSKNKFNAHTEIEAIIKACEWILKEIKK